MKWVLSRYNHDVSYLSGYTDDYVIYDRSEVPLEGEKIIKVPNIGTDIADKFLWIIENYDNLPDVVLLTKANIFKYITKEEFDLVNDNKTFTPLLTQHHKTYNFPGTQVPVCYYQNGIYLEINNGWYLESHPVKYESNFFEIQEIMGMKGMTYIPFAPGSNYILTRENIRKNSIDFYKKLMGYLDWDRYPGEAMCIERGLYNIWKPK